jgi:hypothetical protein
MYGLDSQQVLVKRGVQRLPITRSSGPMASRSNASSTGQQSISQENPMKKLFLAVALVVAFAAPAMAQNFANPYATTYVGR